MSLNDRIRAFERSQDTRTNDEVKRLTEGIDSLYAEAFVRVFRAHKKTMDKIAEIEQEVSKDGDNEEKFYRRRSVKIRNIIRTSGLMKAFSLEIAKCTSTARNLADSASEKVYSINAEEFDYGED